MKRFLSMLLVCCLALSCVVFAEAVEIDWSIRYHYEELGAQLKEIAAAYPEITSLYSIGTTYRARDMWCIEITNPDSDAEKTGIGVFGNIHGGERESAACAMYFAWWLTENADTEEGKNILDNYIIYVVPVINPDGYEQSFVTNTRPNMHPKDANGNNVPFSDPYLDIDGDGYIATLIRGTADAQPTNTRNSFGTESLDLDNNGLLADDPRTSGIDLNRNFDYNWNRYDIETKNAESGVIGGNAWTSAGTYAASEKETAAVQNFLNAKPMNALVTLHTGEQSVLYPWCYRAYDENEAEDKDIPFMAETAAAMAQAFQDTTGRGFYSMQSWYDYPTSAEMIDYAFGILNIHAYTIEVYNGGKSRDGSIESCKWENELPAATWKYYTHEELAAMGLKVDKITDRSGNGLAEDEGLWFYTSSSNQMVDKAPVDQDLMGEGCKDAILTMIYSEPYGDGYTRPAYLEW